MRQKYKVFTEQGGILICDSRKNYILQNEPRPFADFSEFSAFVGENIIEVFAENPEIRLNQLFSNFKPVKAAGGLLIHKNELLIIYRNGFWDLPKGHLDHNETVDAAAIREVREECGVSNQIEIVDFFQQTNHVYLLGSSSILKRTDWFIMKSAFKERLKPQIEEGISACKWVRFDDLDEYLGQSFISIRELLSDFIKVNGLNG